MDKVFFIYIKTFRWSESESELKQTRTLKPVYMAENWFFWVFFNYLNLDTLLQPWIKHFIITKDYSDFNTKSLSKLIPHIILYFRFVMLLNWPDLLQKSPLSFVIENFILWLTYFSKYSYCSSYCIRHFFHTKWHEDLQPQVVSCF